MRGESASSCSGVMITLFEVGPVAGLSDGELLDRFIEGDGLASESAVSALVARHSAMVWKTCRTSVGNDSDASDAFQATFLILLRQARTIRNRSTVAPWLGGVARRVAANARAGSIRRRTHEGAVAARASVEAKGDSDVLAGEVAAIVQEELARLSGRDRDVVLACDLEGLTETEAACRLGCPVGTVRSRLHRARAKLRHRFQGRGLDPSAALGVLPTFGIGKVPPNLVASTVALAARSGSGAGSWAKFAPAAVALLIGQSTRSWFMLAMIWTSAVVVGLAGVSSGVISYLGGNLVSTPAQDPSPAPIAKPKSETSATKSATAPPSTIPTTVAPQPDTKAQEMADKFRMIVAEYDEAESLARSTAKEEKSKFAESKVLSAKLPNVSEFSRRMYDLATLDPKSKIACDAAMWVINKPFMGDGGEYGWEFDRATALLVTYHPNDVDAVRLGLGLNRQISAHRDAFFQGMYANATTHEAMGFARLAYAQYLDKKVTWVRAAHHFPGRSKIQYQGYDDQGLLVPMSHDEASTDLAYKTGLRLVDPNVMRAEAERLYKEVIADYGDVITTNRRRIEAELARTFRPNGKLVDRVERVMLGQMLKSKTTLADLAKTGLYKMTELVAEKPAPDVNGIDLSTNKPVRLADFRGRPVLLLFWTGGDSDDLLPMVKRREATERAKGRPFVVLGVACGDDREAARRIVEKEHLPWLNALAKNGDQDPIIQAYQIKNVPRAALIDSQGLLVKLDLVPLNFERELDQFFDPPSGPSPK